MAIFIEKLKLDQQPNLVSLTITDLIFGDHGKGYYTYQDLPHSVSLIRNTVVDTLKKNNIFVSQNYGLIGISIQQLLKEDFSNYYIEIPVRHIICYNILDLIALSNKNKIVFVDIEEGDSCTFRWVNIYNQEKNGNFSSFLKDTNLNLDNIYFASGNFEKNRLCKEINFFNVWVILQALCVPYVVDILTNNNKQLYIDILEKRQYEKFAVFRNWTARKWRVVLLSILNKHGTLKNIDWSLVGENGAYKFKTDINFTMQHYTKFTTEYWRNSTVFKNDINNFFDEHYHTLPKFLNQQDASKKYSWLDVPFSNFKKYQYSIDVESGLLLSEKAIKGFLQGSMPVVIYPYEHNKYVQKINSLGFNVLTTEFDNHSNIDKLVTKAADFITELYTSKTQPNIEHIINNFDMCVNLEKLASYISQPLIDALK